MKNLKIFLSFVICSILLMRCQTVDTNNSGIPLREHSIQSVLWQQNAAEHSALTYQAYNLARLQLNQILVKETSQKLKLAVITDIDETVLDNSRFNGKLIELDTNFNRDLWLQWGNLADADTIPGALGFFRFAANRGVEIFYISNRYIEQKAATIKNLKKYDFPFADAHHVLLREKSGEKESRRGMVKKTHKILLLLGDNLSDFSSLFDRQGTDRRNTLADSLKSSFGSRFILFPNPMYGDWESKGIYEGRYNWSSQQMDSLRHEKIKSY